MDAPVDANENMARFRAVIQHRNIAFAENMRLRGHKYAFGIGPGDDEIERNEAAEAQNALDTYDEMPLLPTPEFLNRDQAVAWAKKMLERSRGFELPGTFQSMLISQLFWEQSQPWEEIASDHIASIATACKEFVYSVVQYAAPAEFLPRITSLSVDAALKDSLTAAKEELTKILKDKRRHPMTYNREFSLGTMVLKASVLIVVDYFTTTIQKQRQRKQNKMTGDAGRRIEKNVQLVDRTIARVVRADELTEALSQAIEQDMDKFSSEEALDFERAYYKVQLFSIRLSHET